jgi:hypothetical protein
MITTESKALGERKAIVWALRAVSYLVYFYLIVVEIILLIGFFLLLFGANPTAEFTQWAYRNLERVMEPFRGIFSPIELGTTGNDVAAIFDTSVLFAMIIYGIVALGFSVLIGWLSGRLDQIHVAEHELARQAEIEQRQAEIEQRQADARLLAAQQAAAQVAQAEAQAQATQGSVGSVPPTTESPAPVAPTPPTQIPPSSPRP